MSIRRGQVGDRRLKIERQGYTDAQIVEQALGAERGDR
jgi:hypothetical protein